MPLAEEPDGVRTTAQAALPASVPQAIAGSIETLKATGIAERVVGPGEHMPPIPATSVANPGGRVAWARVDADVTTRAGPADVGDALDASAKRTSRAA